MTMNKPEGEKSVLRIYWASRSSVREKEVEVQHLETCTSPGESLGGARNSKLPIPSISLPYGIAAI